MRNIPETLNAWATWSDLQRSSFSLPLLPGWLRGRHRQLVFCPYCWPPETTQAASFALNSGHIFYAFILLKTWTHLSKLNVEAGSMGCISDQVYRLLIQSNQKGGPYLIEECKHSYQWIPQQCSSAGLVQKSKITHFFQILCIFEILQTDFLQTTTINM